MSLGAKRMKRAYVQPVRSYRFQSSGMTGGGFQNVVAVSPFLDGDGNRPYLLGADISCLHYSLDKAVSWLPAAGIGRQVAAVLWSDTTPGLAVAAANEGIYESTDYGKHWTNISQPADYDQDANGVYVIDSLEHPRPIGNMLAQDNTTSTKYLWVATATLGVQRRDNGSWITSSALAGRHLRGMASDPNDPDILYVGVSDQSSPSTSGVYRSTNARGALTFTKMSDYPPTVNGGIEYVEELFALDDNGTTRLYIAGNNDGIFEYTSGVWYDRNGTNVDTGGSPDGAKWMAITAFKNGANITVYAGCYQGIREVGSTRRRSVVASTDGGANWTAITSKSIADTNANLYGSTEQSWMLKDGYLEFSTAKEFGPGVLAVDPDRTDQLIFAGRDMWMATYSGGRWLWQIAHKGLMVTVQRTTTHDPNAPERVVWANDDHNCIVSSDHGLSVTHNASGMPPGGLTKGDVACIDPRDGTLYLSCSPRATGTDNAAIASNPNYYAAGGGTWTDEGKPSVGLNNTRAMSIGYDLADNRVILAGATNSGLWRKVGASWESTAVADAPFSNTSTNAACFAWEGSGPRLYVMRAAGQGLWRSDNAGAAGSWTKLNNASLTSLDLTTVCVDAVDPDTIYFTAGYNGSLYKISNARTATGAGDAVLTQLYGAGTSRLVAMGSEGWLFVHDSAGKLWRSRNPRDSTPVFEEVSDDFYSAVSVSPTTSISALLIGADGYIYTANNARGSCVGVPV